MPWNGAGQFIRTDGVRVGATVWTQAKAAGRKIVKDDHDVHDEDLADGLEKCLQRFGETAMAANLPMGGFKATGLGAGSARTDSVNLGQVQDGSFLWCGTSGGNNALTVNPTPAITAYVDGMELWWRKGDTDNTNNMTLNASGLGAKTLRKAIGVHVPPGEAKAHAIMGARYILAEDAFVVIAGLSTSEFKTGFLQQYLGSTAPSGWLMLNGDTIGSTVSAATQADDGHEELFTLLWNSMADAQAPVSGGRGVDAATDWAADKTITLPDARGRTIIGTGQGSGLTDRTHGATGGTEDATTGNQSGLNTGMGDGGFTGVRNNHTHTVNVMQPWLAINFIVKI
jgi:hypothetical protein